MRLTTCNLLFAISLLSLSPTALGQGPANVTAHAKVLRESFCYADADVFTVSLALQITISNSSSKPVQFSSALVPYVGRVASNREEARRDIYLYELVWSHYPTDENNRSRIRIDPGKSLVLLTGYDLLARYKRENELSKTVSPGSYALQLVFRPEFVAKTHRSTQTNDLTEVDSITTEPFVFEVPDKPRVENCEQEPAGGSEQRGR